MVSRLRAEKDAGEPLFTREQPLWDAWGAYAYLTDMGFVERLVVGDFKAGFGEGLVLNNNFRLGKFSTGLWRSSNGVRPHRSTDETQFLRGIAATLRLTPHWQLTALYSRRRLDATLRDDGSVQTLLTSGLHRTESERARRHNLTCQTTALHVAWSAGSWRAGATAMYQHYDHLFVRGQQLYQQIAPQGYRFGHVAVDYGLRLPHLTLSGETAQSLADGNHGLATLNKAAWRFSSTTQLTLVQRFYSSHYYAFLASTYGENSHVQNESGLSLLFDADRLGPIGLQAYFDFFYSPWPRYSMSRASNGWEGMVQATCPLRRGVNLTLRYGVKSKEQSDRRHLNHRLRATYEQPLAPQWMLRATALLHLYHEEGQASHGFAVAPRIDWKPADSRLRASLMASWFHTTDYDARLYLYEPAPTQTFSLVSLYGRGQRAAATLCWQPNVNSKLSLQSKIGITHYDDRNLISSGPLAIHSSWKADIQLLLRWQF